jgi:hypothetical protein
MDWVPALALVETWNLKIIAGYSGEYSCAQNTLSKSKITLALEKKHAI